MGGLESAEIWSYIAELDRGRRDWSEEPGVQAPVYRNRRRIRDAPGRRLMRRRRDIHAGRFNLGLLVRSVLGVGTPRGLQGRVAAVIGTLLVLLATMRACVSALCA
jgi:transposase